MSEIAVIVCLAAVVVANGFLVLRADRNLTLARDAAAKARATFEENRKYLKEMERRSEAAHARVEAARAEFDRLVSDDMNRAPIAQDESGRWRFDGWKNR